MFGRISRMGALGGPRTAAVDTNSTLLEISVGKANPTVQQAMPLDS